MASADSRRTLIVSIGAKRLLFVHRRNFTMPSQPLEVDDRTVGAPFPSSPYFEDIGTMLRTPAG